MGAPKLKISRGTLTPMGRFKRTLLRATQKSASDVHLKVGLPPIVRVHGTLYYLRDDNKKAPKAFEKEELETIAFGLMNAVQKEKYKAGEEIDFGFALEGKSRHRINLCQTRGEPRLVCRHIPSRVPTISELHLPPTVTKLALSRRGLLLVTGATGSGKSTTLAAMIDKITRKTSSHVITIEDPIEFLFKDRKSIVTQREVGIDTKDFHQALRIALRQDPDVILVGEMRDPETISMALAAAETGHLVLSTLHTSDAADAINRILANVPAEAQIQTRRQLASVLVGVISQRLVNQPNRQGRIPAVEVLVNSRRVEEVILRSEKALSLREVIAEGGQIGMQTFDQSLMDLFKRGFINKEEALHHCSNKRDFELRLKGVLPTRWHAPSSNSPSHSTELGAYLVPVDIELEDNDD